MSCEGVLIAQNYTRVTGENDWISDSALNLARFFGPLRSWTTKPTEVPENTDDAMDYGIGLGIVGGMALVFTLFVLIAACIVCCCRKRSVACVSSDKCLYVGLVSAVVTFAFVCVAAAGTWAMHDNLKGDLVHVSECAVQTANDTLHITVRGQILELRGNVTDVVDSLSGAVNYTLVTIEQAGENVNETLESIRTDFRFHNVTGPAFFCIPCAALSSSISSDYGPEISNALTELTQEMGETLSEIQEKLLDAQADILEGIDDVLESTNDVTEDIEDAEEQRLDIVDTADTYISYSQWGFLGLMLLSLVSLTALLGIVVWRWAKLRGRREKEPGAHIEATTACYFLLLPISALLLAIFIPISLGLTDGCKYVNRQELTLNQRIIDNPDTDTWKVVKSCLEGTPIIEALNKSDSLSFRDEISFGEAPTNITDQLTFPELEGLIANASVMFSANNALSFSPANASQLEFIYLVTTPQINLTVATVSTFFPNATNTNPDNLTEAQAIMTYFRYQKGNASVLLADLVSRLQSVQTDINSTRTALQSAVNNYTSIEGIVMPLINRTIDIVEGLTCTIFADRAYELRAAVCTTFLNSLVMSTLGLGFSVVFGWILLLSMCGTVYHAKEFTGRSARHQSRRSYIRIEQ